MLAKPGDIILYPANAQSAWSSKAVAIGEILLGKDRSVKQYSHVALYDSPGWQVESVWPTARRSRIDASRPYETWRVHGITAKERKGVMEWAYSRIGQWYDIVYILSFGTVTFRELVFVLSFGLIKHAQENVCCTFAGGALAHEGHRIPSARPDQMAESRKVFMIGSYIPKRKR